MYDGLWKMLSEAKSASGGEDVLWLIDDGICKMEFFFSVD